MGKAPKDLDFATVATPDQMREMFSKEEVRMINQKGESHGTITPRINDKENFEVSVCNLCTNDTVLSFDVARLLQFAFS